MNMVFVMGGGSNLYYAKYIISPFVVVVLYSWSSFKIFLYSSYFLWLSKNLLVAQESNPLVFTVKRADIPLKPDQ